MAVRNFWIDADIDGRKSNLKGGPARKDGGMDVVIYQRKQGGISTALTIRCREDEGVLTTEIFSNNNLIWKLSTDR